MSKGKIVSILKRWLKLETHNNNLVDKPLKPVEPSERCLHGSCDQSCPVHCCHNCVWREDFIDHEPGDILAFWCEREFHSGALIPKSKTSLSKKRVKIGFPAMPDGEPCKVWSPRYTIDSTGKMTKRIIVL